MGQQQSYPNNDGCTSYNSHDALSRKIERIRQELIVAKQQRRVKTKENAVHVKQMEKQIYDLKFRLYRLGRTGYISFWEYMKIMKQVQSKIPTTRTTTTNTKTMKAATTTAITTTTNILVPFNNHFPFLDTIRLRRVHIAMMQKKQRKLHSEMYKEQCVYLTEQVPIIRCRLDERRSKLQISVSVLKKK